MAKNASSKGNGPAEPTFSIPAGFTRKAPQAEKKAVPEPASVSSKDALGRIKGFGRGWDDELEKLMAVPDTLYMFEGEGWLLYSKEKEFGVASVVEEINRGGLRSEPKTSYGISLSETASTMYLVLVDMERRIVVRHAVQRLHDEPPQKEWSGLKEALKGALGLADGKNFRKDGLIAYSDGITKTVRPQ